MRIPSAFVTPALIVTCAVAMSTAGPNAPVEPVQRGGGARTVAAQAQAPATVPTYAIQCEAWSVSGPAAEKIDAFVSESPGDAASVLEAVRGAPDGVNRQLKASIPVPAGSETRCRMISETPMTTVSQGRNSTQTSFSGYQSAGNSLQIRCQPAGAQVTCHFELEMSMFEESKMSPPPRTQTMFEGQMTGSSGDLRLFQFDVLGQTVLIFLRATEI